MRRHLRGEATNNVLFLYGDKHEPDFSVETLDEEFLFGESWQGRMSENRRQPFRSKLSKEGQDTGGVSSPGSPDSHKKKIAPEGAVSSAAAVRHNFFRNFSEEA